MRTKRQPTIKTLLLLIAVVAVQCAATASSTRDAMENLVRRELLVANGLAMVSGILVLAVLPLAIGLYVSSAHRTAAICLGIGCFWTWVCFYYRGYLLMPFLASGLHPPSSVGLVLWQALDGPFKCFNRVRQHLGIVDSFESTPTLPEIALYSAWLVIFTALGYHIAKSCRPRPEETLVVGAATGAEGRPTDFEAAPRGSGGKSG